MLPWAMVQKRSSKKADDDVNVLAASIVAKATGQEDQPEPDAEAIAAVMRAMGRRGGLKGGKARAATLSAKERAEIATRAARARWGRRKSQTRKG